MVGLGNHDRIILSIISLPTKLIRSVGDEDFEYVGSSCDVNRPPGAKFQGSVGTFTN